MMALLRKIVLVVSCIASIEPMYGATGIMASEETAKRTIAYVNHINCVIETIRAYNNVLVLEEEYKALSDNLNLDTLVLADPEIKDVIKEIMDVLYDFQKRERDWDRFKQEMFRERARVRARKFQEWRLNAGRSAVDRIVSGGSQVIAAAPMGLVGMGAVAAKQMYSLFTDCFEDGKNKYFEYQQAVDGISDKVEQEKYRIGEDKRKVLHDLNKRMLDCQTAWLSRYNGSAWCRDCARVTPAEIGELIDVLKYSAADPCRALEPMKEKFPVFPVFWYNLAMSAAGTRRYALALEACERFEDVSCGILRKDKMAGGVAMSKITALVGLNKIDKAEIARCLAIIRHNNWASDDVNASCFCAAAYASIMNDRESATKVLGACSVILQGKATRELREYCDLFQQDALSPAKEKDVPVLYDLARCRILQAEIDSSAQYELPVEKLAEICGRETTGSLEKLYYVGKLRVKELWKYARDEIERIDVTYENRESAARFEVMLPVSWLLLGELNVGIELMSGDRVIGTVRENRSERKIGTKSDGARISHLYFHDDLAKGLPMVSSIRLNIEHPSWPVSVEYIPVGVNHNVMTGLSENELVRFAASKVCAFMDSKFEEPILDEEQIIRSTVLGGGDMGPNRVRRALSNGSDDALLADFSMKGVTSVGRCGIERIDGSSFASNGYIAAEYLNRGAGRQVIEVGVICRNLGGAILCAGVDRIAIDPDSSGKVWLKRPRLPYHYAKGIEPAYGTLWIASGSRTWTEGGALVKSIAFSYAAMKARLLLDGMQDETVYGVEISEAEFREKYSGGVWGKMKGLASGLVSRRAKCTEKTIAAVRALGINEPVGNLIGLSESKVLTPKEFNEKGIVFTTDRCYWGRGRASGVSWQALNDVRHEGRRVFVNGKNVFESADNVGVAECVVSCMKSLKDVFELKEVDSDTDTFSDVEKAIAAADKGEAEGLFALGLYAYNSPLMEKDCSLAYRCWNRAALKGNAAAQGSLAAMYFKGDGVERNMGEGVKWLERAAENGDVFSQFKLGEFYEAGIGVRKDRRAAIKWYGNAASGGSLEARKRLERLGVSF